MESLEEEEVVLETKTTGQETMWILWFYLGHAQEDQTITEHQHLSAYLSWSRNMTSSFDKDQILALYLDNTFQLVYHEV